MQRQILIVDDEAVIRMHISGLLQEAGYTVIEAGDGVEGMAAFGLHMDDIGLILLDLNMPNKTGYEMLAEVQILDPDAQIAILTGYDPNKEMLPGVKTILRKPIQRDLLLQVVGDTLAVDPGDSP